MDGQIFRTMVFTRVIGYKKEMPGSGRWKMITDMRQDCWICAGHVYSLVFWCPGSIAQSQVNPDLIHPEKIESSLNAHVEDNAAKVAELEAAKRTAEEALAKASEKRAAQEVIEVQAKPIFFL